MTRSAAKLAALPTASSSTTPVRPPMTLAPPRPDGPQGGADFTAVYRAHERALHALAMRLTRNPADAADLVQEAAMRALAAWPRFEPGTNARAWLLRIATNAFINGYRKRRRAHRFATERPADTVRALYGQDEDHAAAAVDGAVAEQLGDEVSAALATLAPDHREVVERADLRGERYRDIADSLAIPMGTVMSRLFRARRQLEAQLGGFASADYGIRKAA
ncbi:MAG: sigma-70 family RNA polymerase sigma factor [Kofleriaceae bacterium]